MIDPTLSGLIIIVGISLLFLLTSTYFMAFLVSRRVHIFALMLFFLTVLYAMIGRLYESFGMPITIHLMIRYALMITATIFLLYTTWKTDDVPVGNIK